MEIKNADHRTTAKVRQAAPDGKEPNDAPRGPAGERTLPVRFDNEALIQACIEAIKAAPAIAPSRLEWRKANLAIGRAGIEIQGTSSAALVVALENDVALPDLLTILENKTQLTRKSLARILKGSKRLDDFKRNPQQFIELASEAIDRTKRIALKNATAGSEALAGHAGVRANRRDRKPGRKRALPGSLTGRAGSIRPARG